MLSKDYSCEDGGVMFGIAQMVLAVFESVESAKKEAEAIEKESDSMAVYEVRPDQSDDDATGSC